MKNNNLNMKKDKNQYFSLSSFVNSNIPEEFFPDISEHINYSPVYRAIENVDSINIQDFIPTNIEEEGRNGFFSKSENNYQRDHYSVSVYTNHNQLCKKLNSCVKLQSRFKGIAKGFTTIEKGVSTKKNKKSHVNYYLFDYINNSPYTDFELLEEGEVSAK